MSAPTLYEWAGGMTCLDALFEEFYRRVRADELLAPLFAEMAEDHPHHVALFFAEVLGGPARYTEERGGFRVMRGYHRNRDIQPEQRRRYVTLLQEAADAVGLPDDAEFRSAFFSYVEWGSHRAMATSKPESPLSRRESMPQWGWGQTPPGLA